MDKACFPVNFEERVGSTSFGTMGIPDFCTYRGLTFYLEGNMIGEPLTPDTLPSNQPGTSRTVRWPSGLGSFRRSTGNC